jgi:hypothetical protein
MIIMPLSLMNEYLDNSIGSIYLPLAVPIFPQITGERNNTRKFAQKVDYTVIPNG